MKTINSTPHISGGEIFIRPPETTGQRFGLNSKLLCHSLNIFFSRRCAPCAPPSTTTPPPPLWSLTWSSGGKQRPNVAPTFCDNPDECHQFILFKAVIWVIPYLMPINMWEVDQVTLLLRISTYILCGGCCVIMLLSMTILPSYSLPDQNFYGATCDSLCQPGHEYYLSLWGIISIFWACRIPANFGGWIRNWYFIPSIYFECCKNVPSLETLCLIFAVCCNHGCHQT